jgi:hypothetical protein
MQHDRAVTDLESFLARRGEPLLRTAVLFTGSKEAGEWVSPRSYLPVRLITSLGGVRQQSDFQWLAPTPARLAQLKVTAPAGFRPAQPPLQQARSG